ncbi:MAG: hypothetical protein ABI083_10190 [Lapillicoccus sp.]
MGRHSEEQPRSGARIAALGLLALLVVGVGVGAWSGAVGLDRVLAWVPGRSSTGGSSAVSATTTPRTSRAGTSSAPTGSGSPTSASATTTSAAVSAALIACVRKQAAAASVVSAATTGAADWNEHVMGQTDLEAGSRSLAAVMSDMWGPSRAAGPMDVAAFTAAKASYDALPLCTAGAAIAGSPTSARLARCVAQQGSLDTYLSAATAVMTDWDGHLQAMARHAAGQVSSAAAQEDWLRRWKAAPDHLRPYAAAAAALTSAPVCAG